MSSNVRIIPALAGNTLVIPANQTSNKDHPRSRGEYMRSDHGERVVAGSSPLSRGIPGPHRTVDDGRRIIPALAGNTRLGKP